MRDSYYSAPVIDFLRTPDEAILGALARAHHHDLEHKQRNAWIEQISILKNQLRADRRGHIFFEFSIPRMGKRADVVIIRNGVIYVVEFKVGTKTFDRASIEQTHDYALDLKNFHLGSHNAPILPILIATGAEHSLTEPQWAADYVAAPILVGQCGLADALAVQRPLSATSGPVDADAWRNAGYMPTPTIIEAAEALYRSHAVDEISRSDAGAKNLQATSDRIAGIIEDAKQNSRKAICFITGVPGAGKTLAGLNIATKRAERHEDEHAVFLSGNGPLVTVLREALARDQSSRENSPIGEARRRVQSFIQNIHHFRDYYVGRDEVPAEKVVVFDEAQRAWTSQKAASFMKERHGLSEFDMSEPEFLISVMDRHRDWCTIVCLIGGGQEINTGEAGLAEWLTALHDRFPDWHIHASNLLEDRHYTVDRSAAELLAAPYVQKHADLHLSVSMRSFRAERLSTFVSQVLDGNAASAKSTLASLQERYPVVQTRNLEQARDWLRQQARGTERYGLVASSGGHRLRPEGIHVKAKIDPANWFLNDRTDVRSSYYVEEVATQFDIQGLELDWACICWDADLRWGGDAWHFHNFKGTKWQQVKDETKRLYLLNAYRVLLTRARQGMAIFVPQGDARDATRLPNVYDGISEYLADCGVEQISG